MIHSNSKRDTEGCPVLFRSLPVLSGGEGLARFGILKNFYVVSWTAAVLQ